MNSFETAIAAWQNLLGAENVITQPEELSRREKATFATSQKVPAVIRPASREEVQGCLKIASEQKVPLYPISTGKNWGYGSQVPPQSGTVILDLGRMTRIVDFDPKLAYVTVEPGVTFQQLYEFLQSQNSNLVMSTTGTTPEASVLANVLERGQGHGPYGDRHNFATDYEVVLPTGQIIHTGYDRFAGTKLHGVTKNGIGPLLEGLFSQSNFGIVTRLTIWLRPAPRHFQVCRFILNDRARFPHLLEALQRLKLHDVFDSQVLLFNRYRSLVMGRQYPWAEAEGITPLPESLLRRLKQSGQMVEWIGTTPLYGASRAHGLALREVIQSELAGCVDFLIFADDEELVAVDGRTGVELERLPSPVEIKENSMRGFPNGQDIMSTYWRKKQPPVQSLPLDPDRDNCGLVWIQALAPFSGEEGQLAANIIEETMASYGFEPVLTIRTSGGRALYLLGAILYDRDEPGEDARALDCHKAAFERLKEAGYLPTRLGLQSYGLLPAPQDDYNNVLQALKATLDPRGILAPGRYEGKMNTQANYPPPQP